MTATAPVRDQRKNGGKWIPGMVSQPVANLVNYFNALRIESYSNRRRSTFETMPPPSANTAPAPSTGSTPEPAPHVEPDLLTIHGLELLPPDDLFIPDGPGKGNKSRRHRPEPERLTFLRSLKPVQVIAAKSRTSSRAYAGFVYETGGKRIAILDSATSENAIYVIDATSEDWLMLVQKKKSEVRKSPHFRERIFHLGDWKSRVKQLLG